MLTTGFNLHMSWKYTSYLYTVLSFFVFLTNLRYVPVPVFGALRKRSLCLVLFWRNLFLNWNTTCTIVSNNPVSLFPCHCPSCNLLLYIFVISTIHLIHYINIIFWRGVGTMFWFTWNFWPAASKLSPYRRHPSGCSSCRCQGSGWPWVDDEGCGKVRLRGLKAILNKGVFQHCMPWCFWSGERTCEKYSHNNQPV